MEHGYDSARKGGQPGHTGSWNGGESPSRSGPQRERVRQGVWEGSEVEFKAKEIADRDRVCIEGLAWLKLLPLEVRNEGGRKGRNETELCREEAC